MSDETAPRQFETSPYESAKYEQSLAVLRWWYESALELGCSTGIFTARLAPRCRRLYALDGSAEAIDRARRRCANLEQVRLHEGTLPRDFPRGRYDLITLRETGFDLDASDLAELKERMIASLATRGQILVVHWTAAVHASFTDDSRLERVTHIEHDTYLLDLFMGTNSQERARSMED